jgi:LPXTG-site transpeptidase (sortase) family protein
LLLLKRIISIQVALIAILTGLIILKPKTKLKSNNIIDEISYKIDEAKSNSYYGRIVINKINLNEYFYSINDIRNNVDKGIEILKPSIMPDKDNSKLFLASHSGNSNISYFKNIDKLDIGDDINIFYNHKCFKYKVIDKYEIIKTGTLNIKEIDDNTLTLVTCVKDTNRQLVIVSKLI